MTTFIKSFSLLIFSIFVFICSVGLSSVHAQEFNLYSSEDIFVEVSPEIPGPNESIDLKLKSYSFNLNNYYIVWFKNGEKQSSDYGNREFSFSTGNSGQATDITAVIEINGQVFRKELRFVPSEIDLLWETIDAYTPPFYKGKALPLKQSTVKVTAIPETQLIAPSDAPKLVYYWENNYKDVSDISGFGRQSYTFQADPLNLNEKISVTANDRRENSFARNTIDIPISEFQAKTLFYEINNNERIMTNRALNSFGTLDGDTVRISFHPLYMTSQLENFVDLFVDWNISGESVPPQDFSKQNELYISSEGESGTASIGVALEGINTLLQKHTEFIDLTFTN